MNVDVVLENFKDAAAKLGAVNGTWRQWKWESALTILAGLISVVCAVKIGGAKNDVYYRSLVIGLDGYDVIRLCGWSIVFLAIGLVAIGAKYLTSKRWISANCYIGTLLFLMVSHFLVALILTEYKNTKISGLRRTLFEELEASKTTSARFGVSFHLSELWDLMQVNMKCCGVDSYKDYGRNPDFLPQSCCVLMHDSLIPQPENLAQCRHDVVIGVHNSIFLYTQGCHERILTWFMRYTSSISGLLFASITIQVVSILLLMWQSVASKTNSVKENQS